MVQENLAALIGLGRSNESSSPPSSSPSISWTGLGAGRRPLGHDHDLAHAHRRARRGLTEALILSVSARSSPGIPDWGSASCSRHAFCAPDLYAGVVLLGAGLVSHALLSQMERWLLGCTPAASSIPNGDHSCRITASAHAHPLLGSGPGFGSGARMPRAAASIARARIRARVSSGRWKRS